MKPRARSSPACDPSQHLMASERPADRRLENPVDVLSGPGITASGLRMLVREMARSDVDMSPSTTVTSNGGDAGTVAWKKGTHESASAARIARVASAFPTSAVSARAPGWTGQRSRLPPPNRRRRTPHVVKHANDRTVGISDALAGDVRR